MSGSDDLYQKAIEQGHSAAWDQNWDLAADHYRHALHEFPNDQTALANLALSLYEIEQYDESLRYYLQVAKQNPKDPMPFEKIAVICERLGEDERVEKASLRAAELYLHNREIQKAVANWQRAIEVNPESIPARSRLGLIYERLGKNKEAVREYLALTSLYQHAQENEKASEVANHVIELDPNNQQAQQALTYLREYRPLPIPKAPRRQSSTIEPTETLLSKEPDVAAVLEMEKDPIEETLDTSLIALASILFEGHEDAVDEGISRPGFQAILGGSSPFSSQKTVDANRIARHLSQVLDLQTQGDLSQAAVELEHALEAGIDHPAAFFDLGYLRFESERFESTQRYLQKAVQHPDFALGSRLLLGQTLNRLNRIDEAAIEYLRALALADISQIPEEQRQSILDAYDPIIESQRLVTDESLHQRVCDNVSELLMRPNWRASLSQARQQIPPLENGGPMIPLAEMITQSSSGQVVESLSNIYKLAGEGLLNSAMEESFFALQHAPTYLPIHSYIGELLVKQGLLPEAISKLGVVANSYNSRGEPQRAVEYYKRMMNIAPMDLKPRSQLINLLISIDRSEDALKEYIKLAEVYYRMADLDMARKTYTEALRVAEKLPDEKSWQVELYKRMADIDLQRLDWRRALEDYERVRTLQPDDGEARSRLVELNYRLENQSQALAELEQFIAYLSASGEKEQAVEFVESLVESNPNQISLRVRLADLYRQIGRVDQAVEQLDTVGESFLDAGDTAGAVKILERIIDLNPPNIEEYHQSLIQLKGQL
ncbi:MAG: tetratricopeptide repeat protein [Anaerolineales bacterium]|nr:tetratricopeptide repeat protein [Anaerolineales bacterium]